MKCECGGEAVARWTLFARCYFVCEKCGKYQSFNSAVINNLIQIEPMLNNSTAFYLDYMFGQKDGYENDWGDGED